MDRDEEGWRNFEVSKINPPPHRARVATSPDPGVLKITTRVPVTAQISPPKIIRKEEDDVQNELFIRVRISHREKEPFQKIVAFVIFFSH